MLLSQMMRFFRWTSIHYDRNAKRPYTVGLPIRELERADRHRNTFGRRLCVRNASSPEEQERLRSPAGFTVVDACVRSAIHWYRTLRWSKMDAYEYDGTTVRYDRKNDVLYAKIKDATISSSFVMRSDPDAVINCDRDGHEVGVQILGASEITVEQWIAHPINSVVMGMPLDLLWALDLFFFER